MGWGTRTADVSRQYGTFPQRFILSKLNASLWKCSYFKKTAFFEIAGSLWQFLSYDNSLPSLRLTLKSRAICRLTRPPLVVMYACTIPPTLHAQAPTSGPIRRVSFPWLVRDQQSCPLPPGTEIRNCIPLIKLSVLAAPQAERMGKDGTRSGT